MQQSGKGGAGGAGPGGAARAGGGGPGAGAGDRAGGAGAGPERTMMRSATLGGSGRAGEPVSLNPRVRACARVVGGGGVGVVFELRDLLGGCLNSTIIRFTQFPNQNNRTSRPRQSGRSGSSSPSPTSLASD